MVEEKSKNLITTGLHVPTFSSYMRVKQYKCRLWCQTCITLTLRQAEIAEEAQ
jgi:hypothetical protein